MSGREPAAVSNESTNERSPPSQTVGLERNENRASCRPGQTGGYR